MKVHLTLYADLDDGRKLLKVYCFPVHHPKVAMFEARIAARNLLEEAAQLGYPPDRLLLNIHEAPEGAESR